MSGQPGTFRAKPKNSNYASWLYSLSFFSFFFSPSFSLPPFFFLLPALSQVHSNCSSFDHISVFLLHLTISHLPRAPPSPATLSLCPSDVLSLHLECLLVELISFCGGFLKGHEGRGKFSAAHACQMWCGSKKPVIKMHRKGREGGTRRRWKCEEKVKSGKLMESNRGQILLVIKLDQIILAQMGRHD